MHQSSSLTSYRVLTEIGRQECNWFRSFVSAPKVTTKSNWLQSSGGGLAPHNAYTTMDASPFPPLQSVIIERRWLPSILHMRISMVLHLQHHISRTKHTKSFIKFLQLCPFFQFYSIFFLHFFSFLKKGVIVMMMQQIGNWNATLKFRKPILLVTMEGRMKNLKCPDIRLYSKEADSDPNHREELFPLKNTDRLQEITAASLK